VRFRVEARLSDFFANQMSTLAGVFRLSHWRPEVTPHDEKIKEGHDKKNLNRKRQQ